MYYIAYTYYSFYMRLLDKYMGGGGGYMWVIFAWLRLWNLFDITQQQYLYYKKIEKTKNAHAFIMPPTTHYI